MILANVRPALRGERRHLGADEEPRRRGDAASPAARAVRGLDDPLGRSASCRTTPKPCSVEELSVMATATVEFEDFIDDDPLDPERRPVRIHLRLTKQGRSLTFDFSDSDPQPRAGIGSTRPLTQSGVYVGTLNLLPQHPLQPRLHPQHRDRHGIREQRCRCRSRIPCPAARQADSRRSSPAFSAASASSPRPSEVAATYNLINVDPERNRPSLQAAVRDVHVERGGFGGGPDRDGGDAPTMAMYATGSQNQPIEVTSASTRSSTPSSRSRRTRAGPGNGGGVPGSGTPIVRSAMTRCSASSATANASSRGAWRGFDRQRPERVFINRGREDERELGMSATDVPGQNAATSSRSGRRAEADMAIPSSATGARAPRCPPRLRLDRAAARDPRVAVECEDELELRPWSDRSAPEHSGLRDGQPEHELEQGEWTA